MRVKPIQQFLRVWSELSGDARALGADNVVLQRMLVLIVVVICTLTAGVLAYNTWQDRERRLEAAHEEAATLSKLLAEQTTSLLRSINFALLGVAEDLRRDRDLGPHDAAFAESLQRLRGNLPAERALVVAGSDGTVIHDSDPTVERGNLADRDYFRAQAAGKNVGLFIGKPFISPTVGWMVGASRRVETPDGKFAGVVVAALDLSYFQDLYRSLGLGPQNVITLATRDGILIARQPKSAGATGERLGPATGENIFKQATAPAGTFEAVSSIDGKARIFGYDTLADHPLMVIVGLSREEVLAPWVRSATVTAVFTAAAFTLVGILLWLGMRQARREAMMTARVEASARLESIGRLTSGVAHDFNNLLQVMGGALRLLGKRINNDPQAAKVVDQGLQSLERGRSLVGQLLGIARPQASQAQTVDVNALLRQMTALLKSATTPSATVELDLAADLRQCRTDPARLEAALLNLVVNARDAFPPDRQEKGTVRIATANAIETPVGHGSARRHVIRISVHDNGVGMPPEVREKAAQLFFTTKGERGTGLGLAQVYSFVQSFDGEMAIESKVGAGTSVHLTLPAEESAGQSRV